MFYDDEEELNEDVSIVLCLAVCSDGMRKPAEEEALRTSPLFSKEIASNYNKYIKLVELLQKDDDVLSMGFFSKIITYSDKLQKFHDKKGLFELLERVIFADKIRTASEEQFLLLLKDKWKIKG